jgi:hypothetical protein
VAEVLDFIGVDCNLILLLLKLLSLLVDFIVISLSTLSTLSTLVDFAVVVVSINCTKESIFFLNKLFLSETIPFFLLHDREGGGELGNGGGVLGRGGGTDKGTTGIVLTVSIVL